MYRHFYALLSKCEIDHGEIVLEDAPIIHTRLLTYFHSNKREIIQLQIEELSPGSITSGVGLVEN